MISFDLLPVLLWHLTLQHCLLWIWALGCQIGLLLMYWWSNIKSFLKWDNIQCLVTWPEWKSPQRNTECWYDRCTFDLMSCHFPQFYRTLFVLVYDIFIQLVLLWFNKIYWTYNLGHLIIYSQQFRFSWAPCIKFLFCWVQIYCYLDYENMWFSVVLHVIVYRKCYINIPYNWPDIIHN